MPYSALALGEQSLRLRSRRVRSDRSRRLSLRFAVALVIGASLVGFVGPTLRAPTAAGTYTPPAEERYLQALWPIHTQLEQSVELTGLLTASYETEAIDPAELKPRLEESLANYRRAEEQMRGLDPPIDLRSIHQGYLDALGLLEQSALEMLSTVDAGNQPRLSQAVPLSLDGVSRLHMLTDRIWPVRVR
jgi:hypothetical protein